jgi:predicted O-methyltransferase YrrM
MGYYKSPIIQVVSWAFRKTEDHNYYYHLTDENYLYLSHFLSTTFNRPLEEVRSYIEEIRGDQEIISTLESNFKANAKFKDSVPGIGRRVAWYAIVRIMKPNLVVESGVYQGLGSLVISKALSKNQDSGVFGKYLGTDIDPSSGIFFKDEYRAIGKIEIGDTIEILNREKTLIDIYICDSDHSQEYELKEYQNLATKMHNSSVVISDNSHVTQVLSDWSEIEKRRFFYFSEKPLNHWYPGGGIGVSIK